jgi:hypothetical protein
MTNRTRKIAALVTLGALFQTGAPGCAQFVFDTLVASLDTCTILNCGGGSFFDFCSPFVILADCPDTTTDTP